MIENDHETPGLHIILRWKNDTFSWNHETTDENVIEIETICIEFHKFICFVVVGGHRCFRW